MRKQHSSPSRFNHRTRRSRVRRLGFDSLEDRRLLAGLNVFVFDDLDQSGSWEQANEPPLTEHVVFIDQDSNGRLGSSEKYAITDTTGQASFQNLPVGTHLIRLFGSTVQLPVTISDPSEVVATNLAGNSNPTNVAPRLNELAGLEIDEDLVLEIAASLLNAAANDQDDDSLVFFVSAGPANGALVWSIENGGEYKPDRDFNGSDSIMVRAFDGHAWSAPANLAITVKPVDDAPTAIQLQLNPLLENQVGVEVGTVTLVDIDGGDYRFEVSPEGLFEIVNGKLKLMEGKSLDFEQTPTLQLGIQVVGDSQNPVTHLSQTFSVNVIDQNDPPTALNVDIISQIEEFVAGYQFGTVSVSDPDPGDVYDFATNDNRFEVVDGKLKLKEGVSLASADGTQVIVAVTAMARNSNDQISGTAEIEVIRGAPPWQNKHWALDVNNDGRLDPVDVLVVINALNRLGLADLSRQPPPGSETFVDVNGDRKLTPIDALILINALNRQQGNTPGPGSGTGEGSGGEGEGSDTLPQQSPTQRYSQSVVSSPAIANGSSVPENELTDSQRRANRRFR
jgi:Dockerin type I domain/Cadherin-like domain